MPYTVNMRLHDKEGKIRAKFDNCVLPDDLKEDYEGLFNRNSNHPHDFFEAVKQPTAEENRQN